MFARRFLIKMNPILPNIAPKNNPKVLPFCYNLILNKSLLGQTANNLSTKNNENSDLSSSYKPETIENNPFYSKYAAKIQNAKLKDEAATTNLSGDSKQLDIEGKCRPNLTVNSTISETNLKETTDASTEKTDSKKSDEMKEFDPVLRKSKKGLNDIVKLDLLKEKTTEEIVKIWSAYHSKKDCIFASIPDERYEIFYNNTKMFPTFILPLPRENDQGSNSYEFFLLQFQEHCCYITPLVAYHLHKEIAPVCLTIYHYPELRKSKGIVLMFGEFDSNILNIIECQCLANQLQYYYTTDNEAANLTLHLFNKDQKNFDHMRLIRHLEDGILSSGLTSVNLNKQD